MGTIAKTIKWQPKSWISQLGKMKQAILKIRAVLSGVRWRPVAAGCAHVAVSLFVPLTFAFHVSFPHLCQPAAPTGSPLCRLI